MITKFEKYNESIRSLLVGPSKEEMKDYWKKLGYDQSFNTTEEFFLNVIDGIKIKPQTKYLNSIFWEKNGKILFEQDLKTMYLWVEYDSIWAIFEKVFGLKYSEIQQFIKDQVEEHLNWKGFTPRKLYFGEDDWWKNI